MGQQKCHLSLKKNAPCLLKKEGRETSKGQKRLREISGKRLPPSSRSNGLDDGAFRPLGLIQVLTVKKSEEPFGLRHQR